MLINGDALLELKKLENNSIDSLITDPPAGISFMGKHWDSDKGGRKEWCAWLEEIMREVHRVLKPGAHGLVWAIPRTSHWTATALEDSGFEIRDVVTHLFGSGFPKSLNISKAIDKAAGVKGEVVGEKCSPDGKSYSERQPKGWMGAGFVGNKIVISSKGQIIAPATDEAKQWDGWGTALKPASEHWVLIRKPISEKTIAANVLKWGTGGINIDGCRVDGIVPQVTQGVNSNGSGFKVAKTSQPSQPSQLGRFPANLILDEEAGQLLDEQSGISSSKLKITKAGLNGAMLKDYFNGEPRQISNTPMMVRTFGDTGGASRFFYCAKVSTSERGEGNNHPTVKPIKLMTYLCRLITPPNGTVLDPFMGSGSTGIAAGDEGFKFIGIEKEKEYFEIAKQRINSFE